MSNLKCEECHKDESKYYTIIFSGKNLITTNYIGKFLCEKCAIVAKLEGQCVGKQNEHILLDARKGK